MCNIYLIGRHRTCLSTVVMPVFHNNTNFSGQRDGRWLKIWCEIEIKTILLQKVYVYSLSCLYIHSFAAKPGNFFNKEGIYLTSVNGKSNDPDRFYHWLVKDAPKCENPRMIVDDEGGRMDGMMMMERQMSAEEMSDDEDSFEPYGKYFFYLTIGNSHWLVS